jgi:hypothetical protein
VLGSIVITGMLGVKGCLMEGFVAMLLKNIRFGIEYGLNRLRFYYYNLVQGSFIWKNNVTSLYRFFDEYRKIIVN